MTPARGAWLVLALPLLMACREASPRVDDASVPTEREPTEPSWGAPPRAAEPPPEPPRPAARVSAERRAPPLDLSAERLESAWPSLLGERVRLRAKIERAIDLTRVLVRAGGRRFLVNLRPTRLWSGVATRTFVVLGQALAPIHGETELVELMLDDDLPRADAASETPSETP